MRTQLSTAVILALSCNLVVAAPDSSTPGEGTMPSHPHHAPPFEKLLEKFDVNQDGAISQDEVQSVHQVLFKAGDTNTDGFLTTEELDAVHAKERETHLTEKFAELDINGDGGISAEEASAETASGHGRHRHLTEMDANGDGLVTLEEMKTALQAQEANKAERHQQMQEKKFSRLDNDGDGLISLAEFTTNLPIFDHLDANGNGIITADEAATQQPRGKGERSQRHMRP